MSTSTTNSAKSFHLNAGPSASATKEHELIHRTTSSSTSRDGQEPLHSLILPPLGDIDGVEEEDDEDALDVLIKQTSEILLASRSILLSTQDSRRAIHRLFSLSDSLSSTNDLQSSFERIDRTETDLARLSTDVERYARQGVRLGSFGHQRMDSKGLLGIGLTNTAKSSDSLRASLQGPKVSIEEESVGVGALPDWSRRPKDRSGVYQTRDLSPSTPVAISSAASASLLRTLSSSPSLEGSYFSSKPTLSPSRSSEMSSPSPTRSFADSPRSSTDTPDTSFGSSILFSPTSSTSSDAFDHSGIVASMSIDWGSKRSTMVDNASPLGLDTEGENAVEKLSSPRARDHSTSSPLRTPTKSSTLLSFESPASSVNLESPESRFTSDYYEKEEAVESISSLPLPLYRSSNHRHPQHRRSSSSSSLKQSYKTPQHASQDPARLDRSNGFVPRSVKLDEEENDGIRGGGQRGGKHRRNESGAMKKLLEQQQKLAIDSKVGTSSGQKNVGTGWWGWS